MSNATKTFQPGTFAEVDGMVGIIRQAPKTFRGRPMTAGMLAFHRYVASRNDFAKTATCYRLPTEFEFAADPRVKPSIEDQLDDLRERGTCSECLARTYRGEECVCGEDAGDAEDVRDEFSAVLTAAGENESA